MSKLPAWAYKPKHTGEVVASNRGWVLKSTGELLVSMQNLDKKLEELDLEITRSDVLQTQSTPEPEPEPEPTPEPEETPKNEEPAPLNPVLEPEQAEEVISSGDESKEQDEGEEAPKKRPGRPKKK